MPGAHNVLNALAVIAVADELEVPLDVTREALASFHGVQRRFTVLGQPEYSKGGREGDVMIVDDYGHHPAEIEATLDAAQRGFDRRVVVAFQPHRYTRTKLLFDEFTRAFNKADVVLVTDVYPAGEKPIEGATGEELAEAIRAHGHHGGVVRARQEAGRVGARRGRRAGRSGDRPRRRRHQRQRARAPGDPRRRGRSDDARQPPHGGAAMTPGNRRMPLPSRPDGPLSARPRSDGTPSAHSRSDGTPSAHSRPRPDDAGPGHPSPGAGPHAPAGPGRLALGGAARSARVLAALRTFAGVVLVAGTSVGVAWVARRHVMTSARFAISEVFVSGNDHRPTDAIVAESGLQIGANVFVADLDAAQARLLADPWIADAALARRLPGTIVVHVTERRAAALVALGDTFLTTADGEPFKKLEADDPPERSRRSRS